jgi:hypothetical protein
MALSDYGMVFALGSLCLVGPAMVATLFPLGRFIGLALAMVGLVVGLLALGAEGRARLAGGLGALLHFVALVLLLFLPSWLGLDSWSTPAPPEGPKGPFAVEHSSGAQKPLTADDWLDAGQSSWQFGNARVAIQTAMVGPLELRGPNGKKRMTKESYLYLVVQVQNVGMEGEIQFPTWTAGAAGGVGMTDANGQTLAPATIEGDGAASKAPAARWIAPGHSAEAAFVFAAPPPKSAWVQVRVSASTFGTTDEIRFRTATVTLARGPGK